MEYLLLGLCNQFVVVLKHGCLLRLLVRLLLFLLFLDVVLPTLFSRVTIWLDALLFVVFFLGSVVVSDLFEFNLKLGQLGSGGQPLTPGHVISVKAHDLRQPSEHVLSEVLPVSAGVSREVNLLKVLAPLHLIARLFEVFKIYEVQRHVDFVQTFAPLDSLDFDN